MSETFNLNPWITIGEHLPGNWDVSYFDSYENSASLLREDGLQLRASTHYGTPQGKVTVRLSMNRGELDHKFRDETTPSINVSPNRAPESLAKDIARRLIPDAEAFREVILERTARADERQRQADALRERLLATGALDEPGRHLKDRLYLKNGVGRYGHVEHDNDSVRFDLSLSAEDAVAVLALLAVKANAAAETDAAAEGDLIANLEAKVEATLDLIAAIEAKADAALTLD